MKKKLVLVALAFVFAFGAHTQARWEPTLEVGMARMAERNFLAPSAELKYGGLSITADAMVTETDSEFWADAIIDMGLEGWLIKPALFLSNYAAETGTNNAGLGAGIQIKSGYEMAPSVELVGGAGLWGVHSFNVEQPFRWATRFELGLVFGNTDTAAVKARAFYRQGTWYIGSEKQGVGLGLSLGIQKAF